MILLLDNHDSFVHNLARYFRLAGERTQVVRSDAIDVAGCRALAPTAIVLSPGPKRPEEAGCCLDVVRDLSTTVPILGVCLGHQVIGQALGGEVVQVEPMHGRESHIRHDGSDCFAGCPNPMRVGRYHSLAVRRSSLPQDLIVSAVVATNQVDAGFVIDTFIDKAGHMTTRTSQDGEIVMAVRHRTRPLVGFQFHPESVLTPLGQRLINHFVRFARSHAETAGRLAGGSAEPAASIRNPTRLTKPLGESLSEAVPPSPPEQAQTVA
ncbi:MAG: aminodeoxychorismate/anthranilate synthase component II [Planctomycetaceae bacterium]|nr:MAG: aminodeoxychorismate/anthranilate synthase component II [Planctomycetaceae bacterium]